MLALAAIRRHVLAQPALCVHSKARQPCAPPSKHRGAQRGYAHGPWDTGPHRRNYVYHSHRNVQERILAAGKPQLLHVPFCTCSVVLPQRRHTTCVLLWRMPKLCVPFVCATTTQAALQDGPHRSHGPAGSVPPNTVRILLAPLSKPGMGAAPIVATTASRPAHGAGSCGPCTAVQRGMLRRELRVGLPPEAPLVPLPGSGCHVQVRQARTILSRVLCNTDNSTTTRRVNASPPRRIITTV